MENEAYILADSLGLELLPIGGVFPWRLHCVDGRSTFDNTYQSITHVLFDLESYSKALIGQSSTSALQQSV